MLGLLIVRPDLLDDVEEEIGRGDGVFRVELHAQMYANLCTARDTGLSLSVESIIEDLGGDVEEFPGWTLGQYVAHLAASCSMADPETTARDLAKVLRDATDLRLGRVIDGDDEPDKPEFKSKFGGRTFEQINPHEDPYHWVIEAILPMEEAVIFFGDTGSGKTFGMFDMAMAIGTGRKFYEWNVDPGLVIYVAAEAGRGFAKRKHAYVMRYGNSIPVPCPFYLMTKRPDFFSSDSDCDSLIKEVAAVRGMYPKHELRLVVLDTFSAITPGANESASADISKIKQRIDKLRLAARAAVVVVHHKPKSGTGPRGHSSLVADFETSVEFERLDVRDAQGRPVHRAIVRKQREGRFGMEWRFCLDVVEVGRNKWDNPDTSCVVVPVDAARVADNRGGARLGTRAELFFRCLLTLLSDAPVAVTQELAAELKVAATVGAVVKYAAVVKAFIEQSVPSGEDVDDEAKVRGQIKGVAEKLRNVGAIKVKRGKDGDAYVWPTGRRMRFSDGRVWPEPPPEKPEDKPALSDQEMADFIGE